MIIIKLVDINGTLEAERQLTEDEKSTVTSALFDGENAIYYQGDEPVIIDVPNDFIN